MASKKILFDNGHEIHLAYVRIVQKKDLFLVEEKSWINQ